MARVWNKGTKFCKELSSCILNVLLSVSTSPYLLKRLIQTYFFPDTVGWKEVGLCSNLLMMKLQFHRGKYPG